MTGGVGSSTTHCFQSLLHCVPEGILQHLFAAQDIPLPYSTAIQSYTLSSVSSDAQPPAAGLKVGAHLVLKGAVAPRQQHNLPRKGIGVAQGGAAISRDPSHEGVDSTSTDSTTQVVAKIGQHDCVDAVSS